MITLSETIKKSSFTYKQVDRDDKRAIYAQYLDGKIIGHEVFMIKVSPAVSIYGRMYPERELFPATSDFGTSAWSTGPDLNKAISKYQSIKL